tara:strand:+ start:2742 stop:3635 length:894 start_codon:yes stop_codon:yes gene_type:complete
MKLLDVTKVLSMAAFRPDPDDSSFTWEKRFKKRKSLFLSIAREGVTWKSMDKNGLLSDSEFVPGSLKDILEEMASEFFELSDGGWCCVSINQRYVISLETNLMRKDSGFDVLRSTPRAVLGSKAERGKRYSLKHNPESNSSVLLSVDEEYIKEVESLFGRFGLNVGRICCGVFSMLSESLEQIEKAREEFKNNKPENKLGNILNVISCYGSICILRMEEEKWVEMRSRVSLHKGKDLESLKKIILPIVEDMRSEDQIVFSGDESSGYIKEILSEVSPDMKINDISSVNSLWNLMSKK